MWLVVPITVECTVWKHWVVAVCACVNLGHCYINNLFVNPLSNLCVTDSPYVLIRRINSICYSWCTTENFNWMVAGDSIVGGNQMREQGEWLTVLNGSWHWWGWEWNVQWVGCREVHSISYIKANECYQRYMYIRFLVTCPNLTGYMVQVHSCMG